jgi:pyruvate formate lyase activating enzyme
LIFLIQRFSVQDGPGLRTTVFMKGCPLRCRWCQNPESMKLSPELMTHDTKCILLGKCVAACPVGAISLDNQSRRKIDWAKCDLCFRCVAACPAKALTRVGEYMTVAGVMAEIERDEIFYHKSGGGVTVSGGEPLLQWQFVDSLLTACKQRHLHTALDTSGYAPWPVLEKVLEHVDLVLYDIKHMDPARHREATGKSNRLILSNLRMIPRQKKVWLRIPLIPEFNDSEENMTRVSELGREIGAEKVSILPYHKLAEEKYHQLGKNYTLAHLELTSQERLAEIKNFIEGFGLQAAIGS